MQAISNIFNRGQGSDTANKAVDENVKDGPGLPKSSVVGLPGVATGTSTAEYQDANITSGTKEMPVGEVTAGVVEGKDINMTKETVQVPRVEMTTETVQVPDFKVETKVVEKPVTVVKSVPETVKDVEMRDELVRREEVVLDKKTVEMPAVEMRKVELDRPNYQEEERKIVLPHEIMREVNVVRPERKMVKVTQRRPVEKKRMVKNKKHVPVKKTITVDRAVPVEEKINITQPEIRESLMDIQTPVEETKKVTYQEAATMIRPAEDQILSRTNIDGTEEEIVKKSETSNTIADGKSRDWNKIPVGLPFTEVFEKTKEYTVRSIKDDTAQVRQTWMKPTQHTKVGYKMVPVEIEVTEMEYKEVEEEVTETVLEEYEVEMEVTDLIERMEKWPVTKERSETITTSDVWLEPKSEMMPELAMKKETIEVPRTVVHEEMIQKPYTVEREVMVDKPVTEMQKREVEQVVETTREIEVERPKIVMDEIDIKAAEEAKKQLQVTGVTEKTVGVEGQDATYEKKAVQYKDAAAVVDAHAIGNKVDVQPGTKMAEVTGREIDAALDRGPEGPGTFSETSTGQGAYDTLSAGGTAAPSGVATTQYGPGLKATGSAQTVTQDGKVVLADGKVVTEDGVVVGPDGKVITTEGAGVGSSTETQKLSQAEATAIQNAGGNIGEKETYKTKTVEYNVEDEAKVESALSGAPADTVKETLPSKVEFERKV